MFADFYNLYDRASGELFWFAEEKVELEKDNQKQGFQKADLIHRVSSDPLQDLMGPGL